MQTHKKSRFIGLETKLCAAKIVKLSCCFYGKFLSFVGGSTANALGAVFFMYSTSYVLMGLTHEKAEEADDLRSCLAGGLTGALYKSSAGARKSLLGGAFGLTAAALWTFVIKRDNTVSNYV